MITRSFATFAAVLLGGVAAVLSGAAPAQAQPNDGCYHYTFVSSVKGASSRILRSSGRGWDQTSHSLRRLW
jgi:hypothetical protein